MSSVGRAFLICLAFLLFFPPVMVSAQETGPVYIVQAGDTLSAIARRFGIAQDDLARANGVSDPSRLFPGDRLVLPGFPGIEGELGLHTVSLGETLNSLGSYHGLNAKSLARLNRMARLDGAYVGQALIIPVETADEVSGDGARIPPTSTALERSALEGISPWYLDGTDTDPFQRWHSPGILQGTGASASSLPPGISDITLSPVPLVQGKTTVIQVESQIDYLLTGRLGDYELQFFPMENGRLVALQGVHALQEPGLLNFSIELRSADSEAVVSGFSQRIRIDEGDYGFQILNGVPPETVDPEYTRPEEDRIQALLDARTETKFWQDAFDYPSRYYTEEFVSFFGTRRNYNNGSLLYYHTGLDFYGNNVPIYAPADGVVVLAESLTVRGNTTYIDHGWGVYSGYLHQSEIYVQVGERVERGQVIGQVGATGRVTGPHLHWEIWVGGVPVQPLDWVAEAIP